MWSAKNDQNAYGFKFKFKYTYNGDYISSPCILTIEHSLHICNNKLNTNWTLLNQNMNIMNEQLTEFDWNCTSLSHIVFQL